ncbi:lasso peptide biosynthesis B2 protein [Streptomyces sp. NPDC046261]|uniref:lasso peptide biosynthesis B2 protein n=1 Tax=Streptomyces sp. NPDC046261 TaxID=3157200 RepID=UPI00340E542C
MTFPVVPEHRSPLTLGRRLLARLTVTVAWLLIRMPPARLRRTLGLLSRGAHPATGAQALASRRAVVSVSRTCAGQGCLQRSVATVLLCRLTGSWPTWCAGVRTEPFRAHAWVEADGLPVGEGEDIRLFRALMRVSPPARDARGHDRRPRERGTLRRGT